MKATATAPANIALIKYMGRKNEELRLPENGSVSVNVSGLTSTTTVEFSQSYTEDTVEIDGEAEEGESSRAIKHLERIRKLAGISEKAKVVSKNTFPRGTGLSSSSSGFAALTVAGAAAAGLQLSEKELSILARQGSGSACRSIPDGFCEWLDGDTSETSYAQTIFPSDHWDIVDVVAIANKGRKKFSSSVAHQGVTAGPYYRERVKRIPEKILKMKDAIATKNFQMFGELMEEETRDLHAIFMSAGFIYLEPNSLLLIKSAMEWRAEFPVYFNLNTGQDVHLFCQAADVEKLKAKLKEMPEVRDIIVNRPSVGARIVGEDLF